jgi:RnfABCDGE-type electron transport complex G subunit
MKYILLLLIISSVSTVGFSAERKLSKREIKQVSSMFPAIKEITISSFKDMHLHNKTRAISYELKAYGQSLGYVIRSEAKGYADMVSILVAVDREGVIKNVKISKERETEGYGDIIRSSKFLSHFFGKSLKTEFRIKNKGGDVDAISDATVSIEAVCNALINARESWSKN